MKKYKVSYSGFAYVLAENKQDAEDKFDNDNCTYGELHIESIDRVSEFVVEI